MWCICNASHSLDCAACAIYSSFSAFISYFLIMTRKLGHLNYYGLVSTVTQSPSGTGPAASKHAHLILPPASFSQW